MADALTLNLPQNTINELVQGHLRAELAKALEKDHGRLIESMVNQLITVKERRNYDEKTALDWAIHDMLKEEIRATLKEWIEGNRKQIREAFLAALKKKPTVANKIVDSMLAGLTNDWSFSFNISASKQ